MCKQGNVEIVVGLISPSVDVNATDKDGVSPLHVACDNNHIKVVNELLKCKKYLTLNTAIILDVLLFICRVRKEMSIL